MTQIKLLATLYLLAACGAPPSVSGSAMPLNLAPPPPTFATSFDFDLLGTLRGEKCVRRTELTEQVHWVATYNIDKFSDDRLTRAAIAAAAYEAANTLEGVDAFIVTKVLTTGLGPGKVCAKVYGRGMRLKKFEPSREPTPLLPPKTKVEEPAVTNPFP